MATTSLRTPSWSWPDTLDRPRCPRHMIWTESVRASTGIGYLRWDCLVLQPIALGSFLAEGALLFAAACGRPPPPIQDLLAKGFLTILAQASSISYCGLARRRYKRNLERERKLLHLGRPYAEPCFPPGSRQGGASLNRGGIVSRGESAGGRRRRTRLGRSAAAWPPNARRSRRR